MTERVMVAYDGTPQASAALSWAVREAKSRRWPLTIAMAHTVVSTSLRSAGPMLAAGAAKATVHRAQREHLAEKAQEIRDANPDLEVTTDYVARGPAGYLVEQSEQPGMVVIGTRGVGGVRAAMLGGVADEVITYARGPVVVVPEVIPVPGCVLVAVDEVDSARGAVHFAAEAARVSGRPLEVVCCWEVDHPLAPLNPVALMEDRGDELAADSQAIVDAVVAQLRSEHPDLDVTGSAVLGSAPETLVDLSASASLLVVGSRGRGGFSGLLLGSTSRKTLRDTQCPGVVVPSRVDDDETPSHTD